MSDVVSLSETVLPHTTIRGGDLISQQLEILQEEWDTLKGGLTKVWLEFCSDQ